MLRYAQTSMVVATLLGCVYATLAWQHHHGLAESERYGERLRAQIALEVELTSDVLKTRSGLVVNYDGLVHTGKALAELQRALREPPPFLTPAERSDLLRRLAAIDRDRRFTAEQVERFKSENAVLRNSIRFLPIAAAAVEAYHADTPERLVFKEKAAALVRDVLLLHSWQEPVILDRVSARLTELSAMSANAAGLESTGFALVLMHARNVRERAPRVDELVRGIVKRPAIVQAEGLAGAYGRYRQLAEQRERGDLGVLFVVALLAVLSAAAWIILRMRRSASELRKTGQQLEQAIGALRVEQEKQRDLAELKGRFVSMTSHEFRTPLSAILSSSEMLAAYAERWSNEKKEEHFRRIRNAVLGMTRMLDGILLIGRSDAGKLEFKPSALDLRRFCAEAVETATQACRQDHEIVFEGPIGLDIAMADETLLRHVVENLLSNAVKYSPRGSKVYFKLWADGSDMVIEVCDQGIGILPADQKRLFETFHRGSNVGAASGNGLGLSIVKRAVDLHGGELAVESEVGVGTRFTVRLPCPRSAA